MRLCARNAAVAAGLATSGIFCAPGVASARDLAGGPSTLGPVGAFAVGVAGGVAVVGVAALVAGRLRGRAEARGEEGRATEVMGAGDRAARDVPRTRRAQGSHFAGATPAAATPQDEPLRGRHFAQGASMADAHADAGAARHLRSAVADRPRLDPRDELEALPFVPDERGGGDIESVAQSYVSGLARKGRAAARRKGVAAVLMERMDRPGRDEVPADVPRIRRGRSLVGDVDTWWATAEPVTFEIMDRSAASPACVPAPEPARASEAAPALPRRQESEEIARRVALVEEGAYPERRSVDDPAGEDGLWEQALRALDDKIQAADAERLEVASSSGADETARLPGRARREDVRGEASGRSDFDSTDGYLDYLVRDEMERRGAGAHERAEAPSYLKVIEGGSTANLMRAAREAADDREQAARGDGSEPAPAQGRHFAAAAEA